MTAGAAVLTPPATLSGLCRAVVDAGRSLGRRYLPHFSSWHDPVPERLHPDFFRRGGNDPRCMVCDGGALIAASGAPPTESRTPGTFPRAMRDTLYAGDRVRNGLWMDAAARLEIHLSEAQEEWEARFDLEDLEGPDCPLFIGWPEFHRHLDSLEKIARRLKAAGL